MISGAIAVPRHWQDRLAGYFAGRGCIAPDIALLQPAEPFLDIAGEDLRRRIFLTQDGNGAHLCLRPEFTIPVCLAHLERADGPARYGYCGVVFRQRREEPSEFSQAGIEDLGDHATARADARSIADALGLVETVSPQGDWRVTLGDQGVFEAVVRALGLPSGWRKKLARSFGSPDKVEALLESLGAPRERPSGLPEPVAAALEAGDGDALAQAIEVRMDEFGYLAAASRTPREIASRMLEQSALENARLPEGHVEDLRRFLSIRISLDRAAEAVSAHAARLGSGMELALDVFVKRIEALRQQGVPLERIDYDAAFGRPLDYYTGLVYEIAAPGASRPVAGGGRYDRLLTLLGARTAIPGVGFSVWLDRLGVAA